MVTTDPSNLFTGEELYPLLVFPWSTSKGYTKSTTLSDPPETNQVSIAQDRIHMDFLNADN